MIAKALDSYGLDSAEVFAQAGLEHSKLRDPLARFPSQAVLQLWRIAVVRTGDPCFGITVARFWHPTTLHALGYSWLASDNLAEAFECAARYSRLVNTASHGLIKIDDSGDYYKVMADRKHSTLPVVDAGMDAGMAVLAIMSQTAYGDEFRLHRVTFMHPQPPCAERFDELFGVPVEFDQPEVALWMEHEIVNESLATANPELVRINDGIVTDYLAQLDRSDLGMRVRSKLIEHLPAGRFSEAEIAASVNVSQRSLQRKLREQGMTYKQLVEDTRRDLSLQYVRDPGYSFNEVAFLLGFTEPANFSRAFKRWYGTSPSDFRRQSLS